MNTDVEIIFINKTFFKIQFKDISIRVMIISTTMCNLNVNRHQTNKYVIVFMYFEEKNANDETIKAMMIEKIHLIKNLETN